MISSHTNFRSRGVNLQQIEAVCGIARNRYNLSATAEVLGRSQSALSRQIKELELELGVR
jgi:DNA-binding transcriptional LysR family regulator